MNKSISETVGYKKLLLAVSLLIFVVTGVYGARVTRLDSTLRAASTANTLLSFDIFRRFEWDIAITDLNGNTRHLTTDKLDTVDFGALKKAEFTTTVAVGPRMLHKIISLYYRVGGSVIIKQNGMVVLATGLFVKDAKSEMCASHKKGFADFVLSDSVEKFEINYTPRPEMNLFSLELRFWDPALAEESMNDQARSINHNYAFGFYYLAFAIVFIILFAFFKEKTENLYFSLFCLAVAAAWLSGVADDDFFSTLSLFLVAISMELLAICLAKVLKNKDRSKVPLFVIIFITIISFTPPIRYHYSTILGSNSPFPIYIVIIYGVLLSYTGFALLYFLIQGFGQKRWEAKTMFLFASAAFLLHIIVPFFLSIILAFNKIKNGVDYVVYVSDVGIGLYPFCAAVVLGRRNGMNQKKLLNQVKHIERLSTENLEKEREKKEILENQNVELERKVDERTQEVQSQKKLIELKNKAITDNLTYAQRIQSAILPDVKMIYKTLQESFIFFRPKDIVSGDFYTFIEKNDKVLLVAADCTGHGVSGAFMSMIGCSLLNQIINEKEITEPALILNHLSTSIIDTLKQTENESNDGMDLAICSFDMSRRELQYAGANRPLWLIRGKELIVISPDKFPIGGLQVSRERIFTNHIIPLQPGDTIYIFTDGYADQFGGEKGKKLMTAKFKSMLLSFSAMSMKDQEVFLADYFKKWKGHHDQVDDVLVIGVRV